MRFCSGTVPEGEDVISYQSNCCDKVATLLASLNAAILFRGAILLSN